MKLKVVDLFAGTGAFSYVFEETNCAKTVYANDMANESKIFYDANFKTSLTKCNINDVLPKDIPKHDILTAGFPCQPFSIAGLQKGFNDDRSNVFWKILEIAKYHKTPCLVLENVKNILSHDNKNTINTIVSNIENQGYNIKFEIINTSDVSEIPHHRERMYMICFLDKKFHKKFNFNIEKCENKPLTDYLSSKVPSKYYYDSRFKIWATIQKNVVKQNTIYQYRRYYVRENKSNLCPTLTANMGSGGHNVPLILDEKGVRKLTPRECFRLQGFSEEFILPKEINNSKLYHLAGNSVSIPVVKIIADKIVAIMHK